MFFHSQVGPFLLLLAVGAPLMVLIPGLFLRVLPPEKPYTAVPEYDSEDRAQFIIEQPQEIGRQRSNSASSPLPSSSSTRPHLTDATDPVWSNSTSAVYPEPEETIDAEEVSPLVSKPKPLQYPHGNNEHTVQPHQSDEDINENRSHYLDIKGLALLWRLEFWQQFSMMALLSGIGLMTIK